MTSAEPRQHGFSVMEALVAMALLAAVFVPLLTLQAQLARTAAAVQRAEKSEAAKRSALAYLEALNPSMRLTGEESVGEGVMTWEASPVSEPTLARGVGGGKGRFLMQLYDVEVRITFENAPPVSFTVRKTGWLPTGPFTI